MACRSAAISQCPEEVVVVVEEEEEREGDL